MLRNIAGVVAGYVVTALVLFVVFTTAYKLLGAGRSFRPGTFEVSGLWVAIGLATGALAAFLGGLVCMAVSGRNRRAVLSLALIVLVLGGLNAALEFRGEGGERRPAERPPALSAQEAMLHARQPLWMVLLNPLLGCAGILLGGRLLGKEREGIN